MVSDADAFSAIFSAGAAGFAEVDATTGRYIRANPRFCEMLGRTEAELMLLGPAEVLHPVDREIMRARWDPNRAGALMESEGRYLRPDGTEIWARISLAVSARDAAGRPLRRVVLAQDVTETRHTAERLRSRDTMLRLCLETARIGTFVREALAGVVEIDAGTREIYGLPPGTTSLCMADWAQPVLREDRGRIRAEIDANLAAHRTSACYHYRIRRPDGALRHIECRCNYDYGKAGDLRRLHGVVIDVTEQRAAEERVREREALLSLALSIGNIGVYRRDLPARVTHCGPETRRLHGLPPGDGPMPDRAWADMILPEDLRRLSREMEVATARHQPEMAYEYRMRDPADGSIRHLEARARYTYAEDGRPLASTGVVIDVTDRRRSEDLLRLCLEVGRIGEFRHDFVTGAVEAGRKTRELFGFPPGEAPIPEAEWLAPILEEDRGALLAGTAKANARGEATGAADFRIRHRLTGEIRHLEARVRFEYDSRGALLFALGVVIDVTERRQAEARLIHLARHDPLTGLPNRLLFHEGLDQGLARARRGEGFALHLLDLDRFKEVNDTLGHPVGDRLLVAVAARLRLELREVDQLARLGGDEFAVIQHGTAMPGEAAGLARRLAQAMAEPFLLDGQQVCIATSIGIALAPQDATEADGLMRAADMALYRAKAEGRNRWSFFEPSMNTQLQLRRALELELRRALEQDEFRLFYQPIVDAMTSRPVGAEALLRWQHPTRGLITPESFITLCEENGLIVPLGEWVLRHACAEAARWKEPLRVAVNLSPAQFASPGLQETVEQALAQSSLDPARLELEITETAMLEDEAAALETLRRLKALGLRIALDDFGTGYSSLSQLQRLPVDKVKIDRSFTRDLGESVHGEAIVRAVVGLCAGLRMTTTAEGVENERQFAVLRQIGCTEAQGYLFGRPQPGTPVEAIRAHRLATVVAGGAAVA